MRFSILTAVASISGVLAAPPLYGSSRADKIVFAPTAPRVAIGAAAVSAAAAAAPVARAAPAAPRVQQAKEMVTALKADVEGDLADWKSGDVAKMKSKIGTVTSKVDSVSSMVSSILGDVELGGLSEADKKFALGMFADAQELASEVENSMGSIDSSELSV